MKRIQLLFLVFCSFLGTVVYAADIGVGAQYWGWLRHVPMGDKVCHCGLMFTLCVLANLVLKCRILSLQHGILLGTVIVSIVVVGEEFSQIWIPGRSFDLLDLTADFLGIAAGNLVAKRIYPVLMARGKRSKDCMV